MRPTLAAEASSFVSTTLYVPVALVFVLPPTREAFVASSAGLTEPTRITETACARDRVWSRTAPRYMGAVLALRLILTLVLTLALAPNLRDREE